MAHRRRGRAGVDVEEEEAEEGVVSKGGEGGMNLYIAGAYADRERVLSVMADAARAGHEIAHDWVSVIDRVRGGEGHHDRDLPADEALRHALGDIRKILLADAFWLLAPPEGRGRGCWVEMGVAFEGEVPIVVSGPTARDTVFTVLGHRFDTDAAALSYINTAQRAREAFDA
jgi:hypothetical protein